MKGLVNMKKHTSKYIAFIAAAALAIPAVFTACTSGKSDNNTANNDNDVQSASSKTVRFLNFKPEIATVYEEIVGKYN